MGKQKLTTELGCQYSANGKVREREISVERFSTQKNRNNTIFSIQLGAKKVSLELTKAQAQDIIYSLNWALEDKSE